MSYRLLRRGGAFPLPGYRVTTVYGDVFENVEPVPGPIPNYWKGRLVRSSVPNFWGVGEVMGFTQAQAMSVENPDEEPTNA